jgi:lysophospholipase L1-like esterase
VTVLNRGVNGEEASQMLARFDQAVVAAHPDLVIWQLGTNALFGNTNLEALASTLRQGLDRLKAIGADVIVVDPQFAPQVIATRQTDRMLTLLSASTKMQNVGLFHRYDLMRYWNEEKHLPFAQFVSPDGLHMNDWGYTCMAKNLANAIAEAATRVQTAHAPTTQHH